MQIFIDILARKLHENKTKVLSEQPSGNIMVDAAKGDEALLMKNMLDASLAILSVCAEYDLPLEQALAEVLTHPEIFKVKPFLIAYRAGKIPKHSQAFDSINAVLVESRRNRAEAQALRDEAAKPQPLPQTPPDIA